METDYWNALDQRKIAEDIKVEPGRLGVSAHPMKEPLSELKAKSFMGASRVELGFAGKEKGVIGKGAFSPEMVGKTERETIRELAKISEMELTTHATIGVGGFSGLTDKGFSEEEREKALFEIKRTADFAADTAQGGPIVVHTGEFPRPIYRPEEKFKAFPEEKEKMIVRLVDEKTGEIFGLKKDVKIPVPKMKYNEETKKCEYEFDEYGRHKWEERKYDYYENPENKQKILNELKTFNIKLDLEKINPAQLFYADHKRKELEQYESEELRMAKNAQEMREELKNIEKFKQVHSDLLKTSEREKLKQAMETQLGVRFPGAFPTQEDLKKHPEKYEEYVYTPEKFLEKMEGKLKREIQYWDEGSISHGKRVELLKEEIQNTKPIEEVAVKKSAETIARAAMYAYDVERKRGLKKPLFIAPENIFPESYGSHPQELRTLVLKSRESMTNQLVTKGYSKEEAVKIAKEHVKATFDVGHAYTWKKYFQGKEAEFNSWLNEQVAQLTKEGIIGHVHISDNFGYYDEHLAPGEGSVPIKDFAKELEKQGYKGPMIIEAGAQPEGEEYQVLTEAFRTLQSPVYRIDSLSQTWSDIENSYFARTSGTPGYLVGDYVPSKDWTLWTEAPLE